MRKEMVLYFIIYGFTDFVSFEYNVFYYWTDPRQHGIYL